MLISSHQVSKQRLNINALIILVSYKAWDTRYSIQEVEFNFMETNKQSK